MAEGRAQREVLRDQQTQGHQIHTPKRTRDDEVFEARRKEDTGAVFALPAGFLCVWSSPPAAPLF